MTTMEHVVDAVREQGREIMFLSELKFGLGSKKITGLATQMRQIQFASKLLF